MIKFETVFDTRDVENLADHEAVANVVYDGLMKAMAFATEIVRNAVVDKAPFVTGYLRNSFIAYERSEIAGEVVEFIGEVRSYTPYALAVEIGQPPGTEVDYEALRLWAKRKFGYNDSDAGRVAYFVKKKIKEKGTKGAHMFEKGYEATVDRVNRVFDSAHDSIVKKLALI